LGLTKTQISELFRGDEERYEDVASSHNSQKFKAILCNKALRGLNARTRLEVLDVVARLDPGAGREEIETALLKSKILVGEDGRLVYVNARSEAKHVRNAIAAHRRILKNAKRSVRNLTLALEEREVKIVPSAAKQHQALPSAPDNEVLEERAYYVERLKEPLMVGVKTPADEKTDRLRAKAMEWLNHMSTQKRGRFGKDNFNNEDLEMFLTGRLGLEISLARRIMLRSDAEMMKVGEMVGKEYFYTELKAAPDHSRLLRSGPKRQPKKPVMVPAEVELMVAQKEGEREEAWYWEDSDVQEAFPRVMQDDAYAVLFGQLTEEDYARLHGPHALHKVRAFLSASAYGDSTDYLDYVDAIEYIRRGSKGPLKPRLRQLIDGDLRLKNMSIREQGKFSNPSETMIRSISGILGEEVFVVGEFKFLEKLASVLRDQKISCQQLTDGFSDGLHVYGDSESVRAVIRRLLENDVELNPGWGLVRTFITLYVVFFVLDLTNVVYVVMDATWRFRASFEEGFYYDEHRGEDDHKFYANYGKEGDGAFQLPPNAMGPCEEIRWIRDTLRVRMTPRAHLAFEEWCRLTKNKNYRQVIYDARNREYVEHFANRYVFDGVKKEFMNSINCGDRRHAAALVKRQLENDVEPNPGMQPNPPMPVGEHGMPASRGRRPPPHARRAAAPTPEPMPTRETRGAELRRMELERERRHGRLREFLQETEAARAQLEDDERTMELYERAFAAAVADDPTEAVLGGAPVPPEARQAPQPEPVGAAPFVAAAPFLGQQVPPRPQFGYEGEPDVGGPPPQIPPPPPAPQAGPVMGAVVQAAQPQGPGVVPVIVNVVPVPLPGGPPPPGPPGGGPPPPLPPPGPVGPVPAVPPPVPGVPAAAPAPAPGHMPFLDEPFFPTANSGIHQGNLQWYSGGVSSMEEICDVVQPLYSVPLWRRFIVHYIIIACYVMLRFAFFIFPPHPAISAFVLRHVLFLFLIAIWYFEFEAEPETWEHSVIFTPTGIAVYPTDVRPHSQRGSKVGANPEFFRMQWTWRRIDNMFAREWQKYVYFFISPLEFWFSRPQENSIDTIVELRSLKESMPCDVGDDSVFTILKDRIMSCRCVNNNVLSDVDWLGTYRAGVAIICNKRQRLVSQPGFQNAPRGTRHSSH